MAANVDMARLRWMQPRGNGFAKGLPDDDLAGGFKLQRVGGKSGP